MLLSQSALRKCLAALLIVLSQWLAALLIISNKLWTCSLQICYKKTDNPNYNQTRRDYIETQLTTTNQDYNYNETRLTTTKHNSGEFICSNIRACYTVSNHLLSNTVCSSTTQPKLQFFNIK